MIHLAPGEPLLHVVRKHWFILLRDSFGVVLFAALPFLVAPYALGTVSELSLEAVALPAFSLTDPLLLVLAAGWLSLWWAKLFGVWTDYYLDAWVLTDRRVIDIDQKGFFRREVSSLRMERIQDVTIETNGILETLLNFGTIHVQTAGEMPEFKIAGIPDPERVKREILKHYDTVSEAGTAKNL